MIYGIIGLGIMGGSIAKALRSKVINQNSGSNSKDKIVALDKNNESLFAAITAGVIDEAFTPSETNKMLAECDFIFICLYPTATVNFLQEHRFDFKDNAIITDISGVKHELAKQYKSICPPNAHLILGHPMAGGEKEGFTAAKAEYFENHNYIIIVPSEKNADNANNGDDGVKAPDPEKLNFFKSLILQMGFTRITETDADTHDNKIGFTSQLCHVVASAMVESAEDSEITSFGGGSFEDLTRIAMINAPLWTELFLSNKEKLLSHINTFQSHLSQIEKLIKNDDAEGLKTLLEDVRKKRIEMQK